MDAPKPAAPIISVLGDSYTAGSPYGGYDGDGWPARLQIRYGYEVRSKAAGGTGYSVTTVKGTRRMGETISRLSVPRSDVILFVGSRNDVSTNPSVVAHDARAAYKEAKTRANRIIVIGPIWDASQPPPQAYAINTVLRREAERAGALYVDGVDWFQGREDMIGEDAVHPNSEGHAYLRDKVAQVLADAGVPAPTSPQAG